MLIVIFFVAGIVLGLIGLRLLQAWDGQALFHRHHNSPKGHQS